MGYLTTWLPPIDTGMVLASVLPTRQLRRIKKLFVDLIVLKKQYGQCFGSIRGLLFTRSFTLSLSVRVSFQHRWVLN